jgi:CRP/FNR family cyclic AMP-dependent transcriptional regulator
MPGGQSRRIAVHHAQPDQAPALADRNIESLALLDVYGRVARLLLEAAEVVDGRKVVTHKLTKQDMAKMIGASREMVSRVMRDLTAQGLSRSRMAS